MTAIKLTLKTAPHVPLELEVLTPDNLAVRTRSEIQALPVFLGKRQLRLEEFFDIEGERSDELEIFGATRQLKSIGRSDDARPRHDSRACRDARRGWHARWRD